MKGDIEKGSFVKVSGDEISALNLATSAAAVAATDEETVSFIGNSTEYKITSDTKVIYVDTEAVAGEEGGSIAEATDHNQGWQLRKERGLCCRHPTTRMNCWSSLWTPTTS